MQIDKLVEHYKNKLENLTVKLNKKRLDLGKADSAKESRFPSGRVELENEIKMLEDQIQTTKELLSRLKNISSEETSKDVVGNGTLVKFTLGDEEMEYFFVEGDGDLNQGIVSLTSPIGKSLVGMKNGESKVNNFGEQIEILEIK